MYTDISIKMKGEINSKRNFSKPGDNEISRNIYTQTDNSKIESNYNQGDVDDGTANFETDKNTKVSSMNNYYQNNENEQNLNVIKNKKHKKGKKSGKMKNKYSKKKKDKYYTHNK